MFLSALLSVVGLGFLCWLLFSLAVYALPFFVAVTVGYYAFESGAGPIGAIAVALFAGAVALILGKSRSRRSGHRPSAWLSARSMPCRPGSPVFTRSKGSLQPAAQARRGPSSLRASARSSSARQHGCASHPLRDRIRSPAASIRIMLDTRPETAESLTSI